MSTIVLAEDHPLVREGIRAFLNKTSPHQIVAECGDGKTALDLIDQYKPDVLIADLRMPGLDGLELTRRVCKKHPKTVVIILSMFSSDMFVATAFEYGALAYVLKDSDIKDLNDAIASALQGQHFVSQSLAPRASRDPVPPNRYELLTAREREVLHLIGEGYSEAEIADQLFIAGRTVEKHRAHIMKKLELKNHSDIVRYALQRGLIPLKVDKDRSEW